MVNTKRSLPTPNQRNGIVNTITRIRSSMKRPRAPIACIRCHHKKIRCDGEHPNCARCTQGGILCAYPSSRRSRNTQPTSMNPFIDNLSQLEIKIHQIEANLKTQRRLFLSLNIARPANNAMMTNFHTNEAKSKPTEKSTLLEVHPSGISSDHFENQSQMKPSRKRASPSSHPQDNNDFTMANNNKRRKHSLTKVPTPKTKLSSSPLPLSPSSSSSSLPKTAIPFANNETIGQSPSSMPQNYLFPALDPFTCQPDWAQPSPAGGNNDMTSHLLYSGQPHQSQASLYNVYQQQQQRPLFLPQQLSPVTTPDYTDDSSDQFNLTTSTPPTTSFHYTDITTNGFSKPDNAIHQHYPIPPTAYLPHTPAPAAAAATASSSSAHSLSHIPTSSSCPPAVQHQHQHQTTSCQTMDIYNNFAMDDLISFDSQNTGMPLIDNAVWYC